MAARRALETRAVGASLFNRFYAEHSQLRCFYAEHSQLRLGSATEASGKRMGTRTRYGARQRSCTSTVFVQHNLQLWGDAAVHELHLVTAHGNSGWVQPPGRGCAQGGGGGGGNRH
jgi:hypothetical protein